MGIGGHLHEREMARAKQLWDRREKHPEEFEPTPAALRQRERAERIYVIMDNSKVRIQEGKRGRGAKKRTKQKGVFERFNAMLRLRCVWASGRWDDVFAPPEQGQAKMPCDSVIEIAA